MPDDTWAFSDADRARLQPLLDDAIRRADAGITCICELTRDAGERIQMIQGFCEALAERIREAIFAQVDHGEWTTRGITKRDELSITIEVDAARAVLDGERLFKLSVQPTERLS
jgi:hypothetical protein